MTKKYAICTMINRLLLLLIEFCSRHNEKLLFFLLVPYDDNQLLNNQFMYK